MKRILNIGDLHAGSLLAPWLPESDLPEGAHYQPNKFQRTLNQWWLKMVDEIGDCDVAVVGGDVIDGKNRRNAQLVTPLASYQSRAAIDLLEPLLRKCQKAYFVTGTAWHEGDGSEDEAHVPKDLGAVYNEARSNWFWPVLSLSMKPESRSVLQYAHHIGSTSNPMYETTALLREAYTARIELQKAYGARAPFVRGVIRFHRHRFLYVDKGGLFGVTVPGWQLQTEFGVKVAPSSMPEIGYVIIEVDADNVSVKQRLFQLPPLHLEELC